jgi:hypothetical protein
MEKRAMNLKPVDFKAVAKHGCFVYCYLDENLKPYYIGIGTRWNRPFTAHTCQIPPAERIVLLRSGLTKPEAVDWEEFYIARYGRKQDGGILENKAKRGANKGCNFQRSDEYKAKLSAALKGRNHSAETRARISAAKKGINNNSPDRSYDHLKGPKSAQHRQGISLAHLARNAASRGLTVAQYISAPVSARKKIDRWLAAVPGRTIEDWVKTYCAAA